MDPIIREHLMPMAKAAIENIYNVSRIVSQSVTPNQCGEAIDVTGVDSTLNDVDLQVFVSAGVMPASYQSTIAYAYPCTHEATTGRPISAVINFNPQFLASWTDGLSTFDNDELLQTAIHELHHAMGFTRANLEANSQQRSVRGKTVLEVRTPTVLEKAREFFACSSLTGLEIEDEGSSGSVGSHWERRIAFEELMVAAGGARLSPLTLAFMQDLGYYTVDFSKARGMVVGHQAGCGFIDQKCNTVAGGQSSAWYFDAAYRCSPDHRMLTKSSWGVSDSSVPSYFQYDASSPTFGSSETGFTDRCPYGMRVTGSECAWEASGGFDTRLIGSYPGMGARCFDTSGVRVDGSSTTVSYSSRCFKARCPFGGRRIEFSLGGEWIACPLDGSPDSSIGTPQGYSGTIRCPQANAMCDDEISFGSAEREVMTSSESLLPESSGFTALSISVTINGTQWASVLSDEKRVAMLNHIRQDVGFFLKSSSENVRIRRIAPHTDGVTIIFGIAEAAYHASIVAAVFGSVVGLPSYLPFVQATYSSLGGVAAVEGPFIVISQYTVDEPSSTSICGGGVSSGTCITIIAIVIFAAACIILGFVIYCVCVRSPFSLRPRPDVAHKYMEQDSPIQAV